MTIAQPRNDLRYLFKYASADTAKKVIGTRSFRWSSPQIFNDPFDHQIGLVFPYTGDELARALENMAESAIFGEPAFNPLHVTAYGESLRLLRLIREGLPRQKVMADLRLASREIAKAFPAHCKQLNEALISFLTHSRVLCLTETPDNVVMWSHYASEHRGVVFKLRRLEELDHRFLVAQKVVYTDQPLAFLNLKEHSENLVGLANHDLTSRIWQIAYRKHSDWAYEREWRVHIPLLDQPAGDGLSYFDEPKELFEAIYLGCRMEPETVAMITQLVNENLPGAEIYQARKGLNRIRLEFERVG